MLLVLGMITIFFCSALIAYYEFKSYDKKVKNIIEYYVIVEKTSFLLNKYSGLMTNGNYSENYPELNDYFRRNCLVFEDILDNEEYKKFKIKRCKYSDKQVFKLKKELLRCPKEYEKLYGLTNETLEYIYKTNHPLKYFLSQIPYYIIGGFLSFLLSILMLIVEVNKIKNHALKKGKNESANRSSAFIKNNDPVYNAT